MSEQYSFLVSLYCEENPEYFTRALQSMVEQTIPPKEIVLVIDGPIPTALNDVLSAFSEEHPGLLKTVPLDKNVGLGQALAIGMHECSTNLVARMDTDDVSMPTRMEKTLEAFRADSDLDIVGTQVVEFVDDVNAPVCAVNLPKTYEEIVAFSKRRCPFRHPSVTFKKDAVLRAGNYRTGFFYFEDWDLFNRMLASGSKAMNLGETLFGVRVSPDFYERRGGRGYLRHMLRFKHEQLKCGYFSAMDFAVSSVPHIVVCLIPNKLRGFVYKRMLRSTADSSMLHERNP